MNILILDKFAKAFKTHCKRHDSAWIARVNKLNTCSVIWLVCKQVLSSQHLGISNILASLRLFSEEIPEVSKSTFCEARQKVGWQIFRKIFFMLLQIFSSAIAGKNQFLWKGRRIFAIDCTKITVP